MKTLFEHQIRILEFHHAHPNSGDLSEVGVGKTAPMIKWMESLNSRSLVICPNTILENWEAAIKEWSNLSCVLLRGSKEKRLELLDTDYSVYVINIEGVRVIYPALLCKGFDAVVVDEAHHIKNWKGSRKSPTQSFLVRELGKAARWRKVMTGTVLTNDIEDLWAVCNFLDPAIFDYMNFWGFRNTYLYNANAGKTWFNFPKWTPKEGAVEKIKEKIAPHFIRFEKREVLKWLPPVLFQKRYVDLSAEQARVYKELKRNFIAELDTGEELPALHILSRVLKLLEITSGFAYRDDCPPYRFKENAKLVELRTLLEEIGNHRVVIWASFVEDVAIITAALAEMFNGKRFFSSITGLTRSENRQEIVNRFNNDDIQYLVCNPACAGEGISLLTPYAIYYSRGWKYGEREQSLGRHSRPGAERFSNVTIIDLIARNTVDEKVMAVLEAKGDLLKSINPKSFKEMV